MNLYNLRRLINSDATDAAKGEALIRTRRSHPFSLITDLDKATAAMSDAIDVSVDEIVRLRRAYYQANGAKGA